MVGPGRLELPTSRLSGVRSNHLSYGPPDVVWTGLFLTDKTGPRHNSGFWHATTARSNHPLAEPAADQSDHVCEERETKAAKFRI
jgi:hypothetical protein